MCSIVVWSDGKKADAGYPTGGCLRCQLVPTVAPLRARVGSLGTLGVVTVGVATAGFVLWLIQSVRDVWD